MRPFLQLLAAFVLYKSDNSAAWWKHLPLLSAGAAICVVLESDSFPAAALQVSTRLSLPICSLRDVLLERPDATHVLSVEPYALGNVHDYAVSIASFNTKGKQSTKRKLTMKPMCIDFLPPPSSRLGKRSLGGADLLTKAVSPRKGFPKGAVVYDLTAGFGQDSLLIANAGACKVHMVERDPIVTALLQDALRRLGNVSELAADEATKRRARALNDCLSLETGDGLHVMEQLLAQEQTDASLHPDIIYLDPMFPTRKKSASVKKNMQILHGLLKSQELEGDARVRQEEALLSEAFSCAKVKVVVKRPVNAPPLADQSAKLRPSYHVPGSVNRWDVYLKGTD